MRRGVTFAAAVLAAFVSARAQTRADRTIAITFDDLPYVGVGSADFVRDASRVTAEILRVLQLHRAPAVAFVNEGKLAAHGEQDARVAVLRRWADAGVVLGNHTYSHPDLNTLTIDAFREEVVRGEVVTRRLMAAHQPYTLYFRHPQTHTGDTAAKKAAADAFLTARGYTVAPHTIENADFVFHVPYKKALEASERTLTDRLMNAYVDFTFAATAFAERIAPEIFGRDIPQTLLIHANDITADGLERLLAGFESRGYRFITLDEAMRDPAYRTPDTFVARSGPTWLWRWSRSLGLDVSFKDDPEPPTWVTELYTRR
jgi:peptidoglycan-N-acetylglucosamine deacetylase